MSFFGFHTALPRDGGHPTQAPGFGTAPDPFASFAQARSLKDDDDEAIDFEDTYDGLGDQLDEANDDLNDATFGGPTTSSTAAQPVGKDFDFYGQTAKISNAINDEHSRYNQQQTRPKPHAPKQTKAFKTGYEAYQNPDYIPDLQASAGIWGSGVPITSSSNVQRQQSVNQSSAQQRDAAAPPAKKMMSLEEVEAAMQAQAKKPVLATQAQAQTPPIIQQSETQSGRGEQYGHAAVSAMPVPLQQMSYQQGTQNRLNRPQLSQAELPGQSLPQATRAPAPPHILQRGHPVVQHDARDSITTRTILQNPQRQQAQLAPRQPEPSVAMHPPPHISAGIPMSGPRQLPAITDARQLMQLSEEERNAYLIEDAKRAKRNHKIWLLSRDNGLMTPQDKNFITRIQLQQLVTATGGASGQDSDAALAEDFYYQVTSQIRGASRQNPQQPLSNFAQTYLFQTGSRQGGMGRRQNRGGDNHMQRMEMQVQRAVEAAKAKPKNKQLVIEGSLGKISFSNARTPKPLLNINRQDSHDRSQSTGRGSTKKALPSELSVTDRKIVLKSIEAVFTTLMKMEDQERHMPPPPSSESDIALIEAHATWRQAQQELGEQLWRELKVMEPIVPDSRVLHPFISFLSYPKGKKAIPRIFRQIDPEKRLTILTMIVVHLNVLDVIRHVQLGATENRTSIAAREQVELFAQTVMPSLFAYVNEAPLQIVIGLLGLILDRANMQAIARSKIGLSILTMLISRAELVKQADSPSDEEWEQWLSLYNRFFDAVEPLLSGIFPGSINDGQDVYVWQFLAASGIGASPDQQQRLVVAVKDRVMQTVAQSKTLPPDIAGERLGNVNLFMRAIGLDVDLLG